MPFLFILCAFISFCSDFRLEIHFFFINIHPLISLLFISSYRLSFIYRFPFFNISFHSLLFKKIIFSPFLYFFYSSRLPFPLFHLLSHFLPLPMLFIHLSHHHHHHHIIIIIIIIIIIYSFFPSGLADGLSLESE